MDAIYGVTIETLAEITAKMTELRAQYGDERTELNRWLASRGLDWDTYARANNAWQTRFQADPSGRTEAQFHMLLQEAVGRAHLGDVRDMSQDAVEGLTLDRYAQAAVAISRSGASPDDVARQFGLRDGKHWEQTNQAWVAKMRQDGALTAQYSQLYKKHAGPAFQEEMLAATAAALAQANKPRDRVDEPEEVLTPELCIQKMQSPSRNDRWRSANHYAHMIEFNQVPDRAAALAIVTPVLFEMIERHDDDSISDAGIGARRLWDLGNRSDDLRSAIGRCLNRAQEKLASLEAAFAPIQDKRVPERIPMQTRIQGYRSLIRTLIEYRDEDWTTGGAPADAPTDAPPMGAPAFGSGAVPYGQYGQHPGPDPRAPFGAPPMISSPPVAMGAEPRGSGGAIKWVIMALVVVAIVGAAGFRRVRAARAVAAATAAAAASERGGDRSSAGGATTGGAGAEAKTAAPPGRPAVRPTQPNASAATGGAGPGPSAGATAVAAADAGAPPAVASAHTAGSAAADGAGKKKAKGKKK